MRTRVRGVALLLLAATAAVYAGLALPLQKKAAAAADAYRGARDERRAAYARLGEIRRRESALRRAAPSGGAGDALSRDPVGQTRQGIVASLEGASLTGVRLAVGPGRPPAVAQVNLSAEGPFAEVVRLTGELVRPGSGVVLEQLHLSGRESRVTMRLQGVGLEAAR